MIRKKDVEYVAELSRLGLTEKEKSDLQKDLSKILSYIEKLKEVDVEKISPTKQIVDSKNVVRDDNSEAPVYKEKIIDLFPEKEKRFLKVKSIF